MPHTGLTAGFAPIGPIGSTAPATTAPSATWPASRPADMAGARTRIVVLSVSAGSGHLRAAQALCSAGDALGTVDMVHLDAMQFVPGLFRKIYTDLYLKLVRSFPTVWSLLYKLTDHASADTASHRLRRLLERACTARLRRRLDQLAPDAIICTHFLPAEMLSRLSPQQGQRPRGGIWVQVTDYDLHGMWVQPGVSGYFAASQQLAWRLHQSGVEASRIHVTGIPLMPAFSAPPTRAQAAARMGIDRNRPTVLLMGGGHGHGGLLRLATDMLELEEKPTLLVVAGNNAGLQASLQELARQHPAQLRVFGYTREIEVLMSCADMVVTKPGGLTTAECMALGLPMIVVDSIPGQEERNADYLLENGAALKAGDASGVVYRVRQLLSDPARLEAMRRAALALGQPDAGREAMRTVLAALPPCG